MSDKDFASINPDTLLSTGGRSPSQFKTLHGMIWCVRSAFLRERGFLSIWVFQLVTLKVGQLDACFNTGEMILCHLAGLH